MMKKQVIIVLLVFAGFIISSCRKNTKKYSCTLSIDYVRPVGVIFSGFSPDELDTLIVQHYKGESDMITLLRTDTLINPVTAMRQVDDTTYLKTDTLNPDCFWMLQADVDDIVFIPTTNSQFSITGTSGGVKEMPFFSETPCRNDRFYVKPLRNIHVDNSPVTPIMTENLDVYLVLSK